VGYNFSIVKKLHGFRYLIIWPAIVFAAIFFVVYQQHNAAKKYTRHRAEYCASLRATAEQKKACVEEGASAHDYLPWGYDLITWPEGITTWAVLATGFIIGWQSWETRKSANASEKSIILQFRPKILVRGGEVRRERKTLTYIVTNAGGSEAKIIATRIAALMAEEWPIAFLNSQDSPQNTLLGAGLSDERNIDLPENITNALGRAIFANGANKKWGPKTQIVPGIIFAGTIRYEDRIGIVRSMGFCRRYDPDLKKFVPTGDDDYNYSD
jgi:hypothetical protein